MKKDTNKKMGIPIKGDGSLYFSSNPFVCFKYSIADCLCQLKRTVPFNLFTLYVGFGFDFREGGKHIIYIHQEFPELRATVARHKSIAVGYIQHAISLIDKLKKLKEEDGT